MTARAPVYINLTNFKLYNANHSISAGDALLRQLTKCLQHYFPNALMAHLSADNFAVLAPRKDLEKKLVAIEKEFQTLLDDHSVTVNYPRLKSRA
nr:diguanylate cyclase [uncultured Mitsuokella sp.]